MKFNFIKMKNNPKFNEDISVHANYIVKEIYHTEFNTSENKRGEGVERIEYRGVHVIRTAILIPIFINFYKNCGFREAEYLYSDDIKFLQIAALLHESAKENKEENKEDNTNDNESAENCYNYLVNLLNQTKDKSLKISEAIANKTLKKNIKGQEYYSKMNVNLDGIITWTATIINPKTYQKNLYQKLICDVEILDFFCICDLTNCKVEISDIDYISNLLDIYKLAIKKSSPVSEHVVSLISYHKKLIMTTFKDCHFLNCEDANIKKINKYYYNCFSKILETCLNFSMYKNNYLVINGFLNLELNSLDNKYKKIIGFIDRNIKYAVYDEISDETKYVISDEEKKYLFVCLNNAYVIIKDSKNVEKIITFLSTLKDKAFGCEIVRQHCFEKISSICKKNTSLNENKVIKMFNNSCEFVIKDFLIDNNKDDINVFKNILLKVIDEIEIFLDKKTLKGISLTI